MQVPVGKKKWNKQTLKKITKTTSNMKLLDVSANNVTDLLVDLTNLWNNIIIMNLLCQPTHYNSNTSKEQTWPL